MRTLRLRRVTGITWMTGVTGITEMTGRTRITGMTRRTCVTGITGADKDDEVTWMIRMT